MNAGTHLAVLEDTPALHWFTPIETQGGCEVKFCLFFGCGIRLLLRAESLADADGGGDRRHDEEADDHDDGTVWAVSSV